MPRTALRDRACGPPRGQWHEDVQPLRPGDELHIESEVPEIRPSKSRPTQGVIKVRTTTLNQNGETVQVQVANLIVPLRPKP